MGNKRCPIPRTGVAEALRMIREEGYSLVGRELVSPVKETEWFMGTFVRGTALGTGGEAEAHLTTKQAAKVRAALTEDARNKKQIPG